MKVGFFLALRSDVQHFLHAASLVKEARRLGATVVQLTDGRTPPVPGVSDVVRLILPETDRSLLDLRLALYASCDGEWLLVDTDVSIRHHVGGVFDDPVFDVALTDRNWPHLPQGEKLLQTMPFNTGVVFSRTSQFWTDVHTRWLAFPKATQQDWLSEQMAVYDVVRTGKYRVKILPGMLYNYPPVSADAEPPIVSAMVHYKGNRKPWLSAHAYRVLSTP